MISTNKITRFNLLKLVGVVGLFVTAFHLCFYDIRTLYASNSNHCDESSIISGVGGVLPNNNKKSSLQTLQTTTKRFKISYVTSYWAGAVKQSINDNNKILYKSGKKIQQQPKTRNRHPHLKEIEASILANINNPYFHETIVFLDGISSDSDCRHFKGHMKQLQKKKVLSSSSSSTKTNKLFPSSDYDEDDRNNNNNPFDRFKCINIDGFQPTYYEIFNYTLNKEYVTGDIVVLANADQVFDHTISMASYLLSSAASSAVSAAATDDDDPTPSGDGKGGSRNNSNNNNATGNDNNNNDDDEDGGDGNNKNTVFFVLSTRGFTDQIPNELSSYYDDMTVGENNTKFFDPPVDRCYVKRLGKSWDAYIYNPNTIRDKGLIKQEDFKRQKQDGRWVPYNMNEMGGENAALYDLTRNQKNPIIYNACRQIHTWHFHWFGKLHKKIDYNDTSSLWDTKPVERVPLPGIYNTQYLPTTLQ